MKAPLSESITIVFCGLRNAGKSSLLNRIIEKNAAIVSPEAGTTTDPVTRKMELSGLGPCALVDTAGIDDIGEVGAERVKKSWERIERADIIVFVTRAHEPPEDAEKQFFTRIKLTGKAAIAAVTHEDRGRNPDKVSWLEGESPVFLSSTENRGIDVLKKRLISLADKIEFEITPLHGLVKEGDLILLVIPIDLAAPKGRLIQPQVETIRDALDRDCGVLMCKERELGQYYASLDRRPALVITDSQAFHKAAADIPGDQPLTSFSILFARKKGDLGQLVEGLREMEKIPAGGKVLVMEACTHHRQADDIGTVKIPRLFRQLIEPRIDFHFTRKIPEAGELKEYDMVIHCAGCMLTRSSMMSRLSRIKTLGLSVTNYGLFLGWVNGLIPRALEPLPEYRELFAPAVRPGA